jgi:ATP-dependent Clp protease adaptor protein ClpS
MTTEHDTKTKNKLSKPKKFVVKFLNDDFTPMDFVVSVMTQIFKMSAGEAEKKMLEVHKKGHAVHGPMSLEIAETRVLTASQWARKYEFPFRCEVQEA